MKIISTLSIFACLISMTSGIFCIDNQGVNEVDRRMELFKNVSASLGVAAGSASYSAARMAMANADLSLIIALPALSYALANWNEYLENQSRVSAPLKTQSDSIRNFYFWTGFEMGVLSSYAVNKMAGLPSPYDEFLKYTLLGSGLAVGSATHFYINNGDAHRNNVVRSENSSRPKARSQSNTLLTPAPLRSN